MNKLISKKAKRKHFFGTNYKPSDYDFINYYELNFGHIIYRIVPTMYQFHFGIWTSSNRKEKGYIVKYYNKVTNKLSFNHSNFDFIPESYHKSFKEVKNWLFDKVGNNA
jgi:hypothetical protein